jgi:sulfite exporter TauE/SafE
MGTAAILMAFLMGFTGSLHCAGMCGPIIWIMPFQVFSGIQKMLAIALYHIGRISVYALMAVVLHSFKELFNPRVQQYVSVFSGVLLLIAGIITFVPGHNIKFKLPWSEPVKKMLGKVIGNPGLGAIASAGVLNGLLPCGLVYMALSATMSMPTAAGAAILMYIFGVGTMPMLVGITLLKSRMNFVKGVNIKRFAPVIVFSFGLLFVLRGLNLGIPYLSPKVEMTAKEVKSSCCHKK